MRKITIAILTGAAVMAVVSKPVFAQQITLSISPPIVETIIKPGKTILLGFTVQNLGDPTTLSFSIRPFTPQGDYGEMNIGTELITPIRFSLDNTDVQLEKPFLSRQKIPQQALVRVRIPEGTPEGDYYFVVLATSHPVPAIGGATASLSKATIGSTLLITVTKSGRLETKARIALFDIKPDYTIKLFGKHYKIVDSTSKIPVSLIIQNQGKNLIKSQGEITLRSPIGTKTAIPLPNQNILAQSQRKLNIPPFSGYFAGTYTLSSRVHFGENTPQLFATVTFIGLPLRLMAGIAVVIVISVIIILFMRKRKTHRLHSE